MDGCRLPLIELRNRSNRSGGSGKHVEFESLSLGYSLNLVCSCQGSDPYLPTVLKEANVCLANIRPGWADVINQDVLFCE